MKHSISSLFAGRAADPLRPYPCEPLLSRTMITSKKMVLVEITKTYY